MSKLTDYLSVKKRTEQLQIEVSRSEGALEQLLKQLQKEFKCSTVKEAKRLLKSLQSELEGIEHDIMEQSERFEEQWNDRLSRVED